MSGFVATPDPCCASSFDGDEPPAPISLRLSFFTASFTDELRQRSARNDTLPIALVVLLGVAGVATDGRLSKAVTAVGVVGHEGGGWADDASLAAG